MKNDLIFGQKAVCFSVYTSVRNTSTCQPKDFHKICSVKKCLRKNIWNVKLWIKSVYYSKKSL